MFKWAKEQKIYDAGFAKGLMLGKAVATRDELERILEIFEEHNQSQTSFYGCSCGKKVESFRGHILALIKGESND